MSKKRNAAGRGEGPATQGVSRAPLIVLVLAAVIGLGFWLWKTTRNDISPAAPLPAAASASNLPPVAAVEGTAKPEFQKLKGKWLRPDGGYVLEVRDIDDSGKVDAAYFNPKPIHVARAAAMKDGTLTKLFVELRDVNYPGSTYTLAYNPAQDQLAGIYYQAVQQQNFEVVFVRTQ